MPLHASFGALRARISKIPEDKRDLPLDVALLEIGYSDDIARLTDHYKHNGSNFFMNMYEAILGRQCPDKYRIKQYVIHPCVEPDHASIAEIKYSAAAWEEAKDWAVKHMRSLETHEEERAREQAKELARQVSDRHTGRHREIMEEK